MNSPPAYALVTGASRGIGEAFAAALAARGRSLILTARGAADLERVRERVARPGLEVHVVPADLRQDGVAVLLAAVARNGWTVDLLVNNAGLGSVGPFAESSVERQSEQVAVNVRAVVELTRGVLPAMRARGRGEIIIVASVAAFQAVPMLATYAATKAFDLSFSLALYGELRSEGIHVLALCPGPTETHFFEVAGARPLGPVHSPEYVVEQALRGLRQRRAMVVCGARNQGLRLAGSLFPRALLARLLGRAMQARWEKTA